MRVTPSSTVRVRGMVGMLKMKLHKTFPDLLSSSTSETQSA